MNKERSTRNEKQPLKNTQDPPEEETRPFPFFCKNFDKNDHFGSNQAYFRGELRNTQSGRNCDPQRRNVVFRVGEHRTANQCSFPKQLWMISQPPETGLDMRASS